MSSYKIKKVIFLTLILLILLAVGATIYFSKGRGVNFTDKREINFKKIPLCEKITKKSFEPFEIYGGTGDVVGREEISIKRAEELKVLCYATEICEKLPKSCKEIIDSDLKDVCDFGDYSKNRSRCYYALAVASKDINLCAKLADTYLMDWCYSDIAIRSKDINLCLKVSEEESTSMGGVWRVKDECYSGIAKKLKDIDLCEKVILQRGKDQCHKEVAVEIPDSSLCSKIIDNYTQAWCYSAVAKKTLDDSLCNKIKNYEEKTKCHKDVYIEIAKDKKDISFCKKSVFYTIEESDQCYQEVAIANKDISICEEITTSGIKNFCYTDLAHMTWDESLCGRVIEDKSTNPNYYKDVCYSGFIKEIQRDLNLTSKEKAEKVMRKKDELLSLCSKIVNKEWQGECYFQIAAVIKDNNLCLKINNQHYKDACNSITR